MTPHFLDRNKSCEFATFAKKLGYEYSWDFSKLDNLHWHELRKNGKLCLQVDMTIPLNEIIEEILYDGPDRRPKFFLASSEPQWSKVKEDIKEFVKKGKQV